MCGCLFTEMVSGADEVSWGSVGGRGVVLFGGSG